ncbi:MAG: DNA topoisomerase [Candidatus Njordarchaeales archaeon]
MKKILVVAEKPRAAEQIARALARNNKQVKKITKSPVPVLEVKTNSKIYRITSVKGHIFTTEFSRKIHEKKWRDVDPKYLLTKAPLVKIVRLESRHIIGILKRECRKADILIIATDFDREGENIGMQVAELIAKKVNPRIIIKRARFSSLTREEIRRAFEEKNLTGLDRNKIDASETRQELDLRYGVAFTRLATLKLHERVRGVKLPLLSIGPCQTPTLGLIVRRYLEHLESKKEAEKNKIFKIYALCRINSQALRFELSRTFRSIDDARKYLESLRNNTKRIKIIDVERKIIKVPRPLPLNTNRLAALASKYLGLSARKTLNLAEKLYLEGLISYPRTETEVYTKEVLREVWKVLDEMKRKRFISESHKPQSPKQGRKNDHAHPPIHPKRFVAIETVERRLGKDAAKLYELICRHFAANFSSDAFIEEIRFKGEDQDGNQYTSKIRMMKELGFLRIYKYADILKETRNISKESLENMLKSEGKDVIVDRFEVEEKKMKIIQPISESELIKLMEKLGIGTDATFAEHIHKNIERGYVIRRGGKLIPTPYGIAIARALEELVPEVIDPKIRSKIEAYFKSVEEGKMSKREVVEKAIANFVKIYDRFKKNIHLFIEHVIRGLKDTGIEYFRRLKKRRWCHD